MKDITTLIEDIHDVFRNPHIISEENIEELGENVKNAVRIAVESANEKRIPSLRMSNMGKPRRQLWFELNQGTKDTAIEFGETDVFSPNPQTLMMFLFGDIIEQLLVFFTKEAGHTVSHPQEELVVNGVVGHNDPVIDGVPCDIKSASKWNFQKKFVKRGLLDKSDPAADPYGYVGQLSGYREALLELYPDEIDPDRVAWLAFSKETAEMNLLVADSMELINASDKIDQVKEDLAKETPPVEKCYPDEPEGKSGNRVLNKQCNWCSFKDLCWADANDGAGLRTFQYSNGQKHFTQIGKLPSVPEVSDTMFKVEED